MEIHIVPRSGSGREERIVLMLSIHFACHSLDREEGRWLHHQLRKERRKRRNPPPRLRSTKERETSWRRGEKKEKELRSGAESSIKFTREKKESQGFVPRALR